LSIRSSFATVCRNPCRRVSPKLGAGQSPAVLGSGETERRENWHGTTNLTQNFLRLALLFAIGTGLASTDILRADEIHTEALKNGNSQFAAQRLAVLEQALERLTEQVTPNHPKVKQLEVQIRTLRDAADHERVARHDRPRRANEARPQRIRAREQPLAGRQEQEIKREDKPRGRGEDLPIRQRLQHVQQAVAHLHAAGLHELAEMTIEQARNRFREHMHGGWRGPNREFREREHGDEHARRANEEAFRMMDRLSHAVRDLEQRGHDSEELRHAVEDTQRHMHLMQREGEMRFQEIEQAIQHHVRGAERAIEEHTAELTEAIEDIQRHVQHRLDGLEQRLDDLSEHFDHEDHHAKEKEKHEHHHHEHEQE